ncbi:hypothetical protein IMG5_102510 [Ichthyophthirius multifiliis]|uniref:Transmembrane protein n=1 Tax=Ichthyophthirius multifiliis TaxID=5932 RepID=G0QSN5_ICHMU|nr:hypothetical protein IMG5_102510 [Ichthyophthirius multifiliis]EGR31751.1 hypothetical protein IMG5_102510 [Ichthyophthirius multifiliis]|eukprot:XP_004035237.1 hypothetical protein IMG5_102510 [Ichthyophthirius multifiliis]
MEIKNNHNKLNTIPQNNNSEQIQKITNKYNSQSLSEKNQKNLQLIKQKQQEQILNNENQKKIQQQKIYITVYIQKLQVFIYLYIYIFIYLYILYLFIYIIFQIFYAILFLKKSNYLKKNYQIQDYLIFNPKQIKKKNQQINLKTLNKNLKTFYKFNKNLLLIFHLIYFLNKKADDQKKKNQFKNYNKINLKNQIRLFQKNLKITQVHNQYMNKQKKINKQFILMLFTLKPVVIVKALKQIKIIILYIRIQINFLIDIYLLYVMDMVFMDMMFLHLLEMHIQVYQKIYFREIQIVYMKNILVVVQDFLFYNFLRNYQKVKLIVLLVDLHLLLFQLLKRRFGVQTQEILELFQPNKIKLIFGMQKNYHMTIKLITWKKKKN